MTKTLIRNATVLSMDPHVGEIECGDVLIEGERISSVGEKLDATDAETIDAGGMILMPGLVNAHMHTWQTALRGLGGDWGGRQLFRDRTRDPRPALPARGRLHRNAHGRVGADGSGRHDAVRLVPQQPHARAYRRRNRRFGGIRHTRPFRTRNAQTSASGGRTPLLANPASGE